MFPEDRVAIYGLTFKNRDKAFSFKWLGLFWIFCICEVDAGRGDIDEVAGLLPYFASGRDTTRPVSDKRGADPPFVDPVLVFSKWRVRNISPSATVRDVSIRSAGHDVRPHANRKAVARLRRHAAGRGEVGRFHDGKGRLVGAGAVRVVLVPDAALHLGAPAVVLKEQDERVVELPRALQLRDEDAFTRANLARV